ncbi:hypothetical protein [Nostoc sp.]|uniref:hypothetical protein n=1 Tax=Nostoc sp. TaxID=1180 RepID=UPI002FF6C7CA
MTATAYPPFPVAIPFLREAVRTLTQNSSTWQTHCHQIECESNSSDRNSPQFPGFVGTVNLIVKIFSP